MGKRNFLDFVTEKSWKGWIANLVIMVFILIVLLILFFFVFLPKATHHGETITVPNLEGMQLEEMETFLIKRNYRFEVADSGYSSVYPPLTILKQFPKAGAKVKQNRKIYLTVRAKMPQSVKMPDLIDGSLKNAELVLSSYGLQLGTITYKPDLASNAILEQYLEGKMIKPGTTIPKGSVIDLVVGDGLGNRTFITPNFIGLDIDEAAFSVIGSGLGVGLVMVEIPSEDEILEILTSLGEVEGEVNEIMTSGHVFRQNPEVGANIRIGEQVDLWIYSTDPEDSLRVLEEWEMRDEQGIMENETDF